MDRDTFILTAYCLGEDKYKKLSAIYRVHHAGFTPELNDAEVITRKIGGACWKQPTDLFHRYPFRARNMSKQCVT